MKDETLLQSRENFISLCNKFWNWQELDEITAGEEEPRLEWDGQEFTHRVTQALWRMYQAALQSGNSAQPVTVSAGYALVPVEPTPEILAIITEAIKVMRGSAATYSRVLAAAPKAPGSQLTPAPGWTGNGDANAALVMLDRIDTLAPEDDDRIEEVKQIIRSLAAPTAPDGWIPVSERMPEMGEKQCYVLAADFKNHYRPNIPNTQVGVYGDWFNDGNPTWDDGDGEDLHLKEVTHWQPLPDAPKGV